MQRYLTLLILYLSMSCLNPTIAFDIDPSQLATDKIISSWAVQVHTVATSPEEIDVRINQIEDLITNIRKSIIPKHCLADAQFRYTLLLECLAWDIYEQLKLYQSMFALEGSFKQERPLKHLATACVNEVITHDIQNESLKQILIRLTYAWSKKNRSEYDQLSTKLELFGQSLLGHEKEEFDRYRMILGPQRITLPD